MTKKGGKEEKKVTKRISPMPLLGTSLCSQQTPNVMGRPNAEARPVAAWPTPRPGASATDGQTNAPFQPFRPLVQGLSLTAKVQSLGTGEALRTFHFSSPGGWPTNAAFKECLLCCAQSQTGFSQSVRQTARRVSLQTRTHSCIVRCAVQSEFCCLQTDTLVNK